MIDIGLSCSSIAGKSITRERIKNDFYVTPEYAIRSILDREKLIGSILENACGNGAISEILKEYYPDQLIVSTDLIDRGYGIPGIDFLNHDYGFEFDNIITNPPFEHIEKFIYKSLAITRDKVIIFAKIQLLEGEKRRKMFEEVPLKYVYVFSKRQTPLPNGNPYNEQGKKWSGAICFAWFVFQHGYDKEPIIKWI